MTPLVRSVRSADTLTREALAVLQPGFTGTTAPDWLLRRLGEGLVSVGLFGRNVADPAQLAALTGRLRAEREELIVAIDEEGGDVTRLEVRGGSSFPGNHALGAADDTELTRAVARELGHAAGRLRHQPQLGPLRRRQLQPRQPGHRRPLLRRRSAAGRPAHRRLRRGPPVRRLSPPAPSTSPATATPPSTRTTICRVSPPVCPPSRRANWCRSAPPSPPATRAVMSAHILLPALDAEHPATLSPAALHGLLRAPEAEGGLGFDGLIVTDGMEMQAISATYGIERGSVLALAAGADAICVGGGLADEDIVLRLRDALVRAVREGELPEQRLADAAARVRALAYRARRTGTGRGPRPPQVSDSPRPGAPCASPPPQLVPAPARARLRRRLHPLANIAVGDETPWGVAAELARLLPGTETATCTAEAAAAAGTAALVDGLLTAAAYRRLVAVVRDVHRHPWMADALHTLLAARPDTAVVEMGVPQAPPQGALHLATHGAARVCAQAAAEALTGRRPSPDG